MPTNNKLLKSRTKKYNSNDEAMSDRFWKQKQHHTPAKSAGLPARKKYTKSRATKKYNNNNNSNGFNNDEMNRRPSKQHRPASTAAGLVRRKALNGASENEQVIQSVRSLRRILLDLARKPRHRYHPKLASSSSSTSLMVDPYSARRSEATSVTDLTDYELSFSSLSTDNDFDNNNDDDDVHISRKLRRMKRRLFLEHVSEATPNTHQDQIKE